MEEKKSVGLNTIAGILFAVTAFHSFLNLNLWNINIYSLLSAFFVRSIIVSFFSVAGFVLVAVSLLTKRRDILCCAGFGVLALMRFVTGLFFNGADFKLFLEFLGYLSAAAVSFVLVTDYLPDFKEIVKRLCFIPAAFITARTGVTVLGLLFNFLFFGAVAALFWGAVEICAFLLACAWLAYPDGIPNIFVNQTAGGTFKYESDATQVYETEETQQENAGGDTQSSAVVSELKEYKKLLDDGIITQEEFDAKKKQLLGL